MYRVLRTGIKLQEKSLINADLGYKRPLDTTLDSKLPSPSSIVSQTIESKNTKHQFHVHFQKFQETSFNKSITMKLTIAMPVLALALGAFAGPVAVADAEPVQLFV